ncbi:hypothetical protein Patl1_24430 [Pistacia atlantica]|uniref:Uncharacterized protein n=1 Tax=Pistacia atlantica TaxID=434234 RepID=A0ACC0ZXU2_9ROSI|nr:hypothetical protein Patl1_24430 [Pistacia atlantica]
MLTSLSSITEKIKLKACFLALLEARNTYTGCWQTLKDIGDYIVDVICKPAGLGHNHGAISLQKDNSSA